jgi:hypothetical protein
MGGAKAPAVAPVPPAALPATLANPAVAMSGANQKNAAVAAAGAGFDGTLTNASGAGGLSAPATAGRSLLG